MVVYSDSWYSRPWMSQMSPAIADKPIFQPPIPFTTLFQLNSKKTQTTKYVFSLYYQRHYKEDTAIFWRHFNSRQA